MQTTHHHNRLFFSVQIYFFPLDLLRNSEQWLIAITGVWSVQVRFLMLGPSNIMLTKANRDFGTAW